MWGGIWDHGSDTFFWDVVGFECPILSPLQRLWATPNAENRKGKSSARAGLKSTTCGVSATCSRTLVCKSADLMRLGHPEPKLSSHSNHVCNWISEKENCRSHDGPWLLLGLICFQMTPWANSHNCWTRKFLCNKINGVVTVNSIISATWYRRHLIKFLPQGHNSCWQTNLSSAYVQCHRISTNGLVNSPSGTFSSLLQNQIILRHKSRLIGDLTNSYQ